MFQRFMLLSNGDLDWYSSTILAQTNTLNTIRLIYWSFKCLIYTLLYYMSRFSFLYIERNILGALPFLFLNMRLKLERLLKPLS